MWERWLVLPRCGPAYMAKGQARAFQFSQCRFRQFVPRRCFFSRKRELSKMEMYRPIVVYRELPQGLRFPGHGQGLPFSTSRIISDEQPSGLSRTPWHREGSDVAPAAKPASAGEMTKGKLLTTPSHLLKLIIPLKTTFDTNSERKDEEPLALLIHPQQPLSYLERLIQSELPPITNDKGEGRVPAVNFRAEDSQQDAIQPKAKHEKTDDTAEDLHEDAIEEEDMNGKKEKTGVVGKGDRVMEDNNDKENLKPGVLADGGVESYSGAGHTSPSKGHEKFVRWSKSTDIGDFIRDAARGQEFEIEIEGTAKPIRIGVPSFNDRTHYLRLRLRKTANMILDLTKIKAECDMAAHKAGQRVAIAGAGVLVGYWYVVYRLTFETDLGWDTMEPVTYLVGLSTLICGYLWFLYHNREVSYRSAMHLTVSRRQDQLYKAKGFDHSKWDALIDEANGYRKEIKRIASEYDVEWDERDDEKHKKVTEAMKEVRIDREKEEKKKDDD